MFIRERPTLLIVPALVLAATSLASAAPVNLLDNPSFEDGTDSWTESRNGGAAISASTEVTANSGSHSLRVRTGRGGSQFITAIQSGIGITAGEYDASVYVYDTGDVSEAYRFILSILFSDGDGDVLASYSTGSLDSAGLTDEAWTQFTLSDFAADPIVAPLGTTQAQFRFDWRPKSNADTTGDVASLRTLYIDDASFVLVPEPASLALLGLGGLAMLSRRRGAAGSR